MGFACKESESEFSIAVVIIRISLVDTNFVLYLGRHTLETALLVSAPVLVTCVVVGVTITLFQAVTSVRDMSLTIVPKLLAMSAVLMLFGGWMLEIIVKFVNELFGYIQTIGH
jgi:flagellar biosynthetic protein FliQ